MIFSSSLRRRTAFLLMLLIILILPSISLLQAAGSRSLYPTGYVGSRASLEWRLNDGYGPITAGTPFLIRRTLLKVYAQAGEVILLGSNAIDGNTTPSDILIYDPTQVTGAIGNEAITGAPVFSCEAQRTGPGGLANQGTIANRLQELAGPDTIPVGTVPNGYVPCFYVVPAEGIYNVVMYGPAGNADTNTAPNGSVNPIAPAVGTSVGAWDVTVRASVVSTTDIIGRIFTYYFAGFTGDNARPVNSILYTVTTDGYRYLTNLNGLDPNGFVFYGSRKGFLDTDGSPLYHDIVAGPGTSTEVAQLRNPLGGVTLDRPAYPIFFEPPANETLTAANVPTTPITASINSFSFDGSVGGITSTVDAGGTFEFDFSTLVPLLYNPIYQIVISYDGVDFDPTNPLNKVLRAESPAGPQLVAWDGRSNDGTTVFPVGTYEARLIIRTGEYHFPLLDAENSVNGGPSFTLSNPPGGLCPPFNGGCNSAFYDDRGYTTADGIATVGTPGIVLCGNNPPATPASDQINGYDSTTNQRAFGTGAGGNNNAPCTGAFGDGKGLDLWTYYPNGPLLTPLQIVAAGPDLYITKDDGAVTTTPGGTVVYTLSYGNNGPSPATGVVISETVPANTTFNAPNSTAGWSCANDAPAGTICTLNVGAVAAGAPVATAAFAVTLVDSLPAGVNEVLNAVTIGDDGQNGPDPDPGNNGDTDNTPVNAAPDLKIVKTDNNVATAPGGTVVYTLNYENTGNQAATGVVINETVPANTTFNVASSTAGWSCANDAPAGTACTFSVGTLAVNTPGSVNFAVMVNNPLPAGVTQLTNATTIGDDGTNGPDPTPGDNGSTDTTPIANIDIVKTAGAAPDGGTLEVDQAPSNVTYTYVVRNTGGTHLTDITITDDAGTPADPGDDVTISSAECAGLAGPLAPNATVTCTAVFNIDSDTTNIAVATGTPSDANGTAYAGAPKPVANDDAVVVLGPTAIDLVSFTAQPAGNQIVVAWQTSREVETWGFHLYRSSDGTRANAVRVTDTLIAAQGRGKGGASYSWTDTAVQPGIAYSYWLQEVELDGTSHEYGTASAMLQRLDYSLFMPFLSR